MSRTETKGTVFSSIGETTWYLARTNNLDFIAYYLPRYRKFSDDKRTLYGGYGPRLFRMRGNVDQIRNVINLLKQKRNTRQAVIQLFDAKDIVQQHKDVPCTCTLQFMIRGGQLHMLTNMRSNDAYIGLPHDVFAFTFLQEIIARSVGVRLGIYKHAVGSLHLYDNDRAKARQFLKEGWQSTIAESYMEWVAPPRTHQQMIQEAHKQVGQNPRQVFDFLYHSMNKVLRFGRLAKFDYLTMLGKLGLAPIEPGSAYLDEATGPRRGARLLFGGSVDAKLSGKTLDSLLNELDTEINVGMQVLEDGLCNWQKSPNRFSSFRG